MNRFRYQLCQLAITALLFMSSTIGWAQTFTSRSLVEDFGQTATKHKSAPRPLAMLGVGLIMDFEGWRPVAYDDPVGLCTIGYGHLIALKKCSLINLGKYGNPLNLDQGASLLELDTRSARGIVEKLVTSKLNEHEFGALSSFVFNVGKEKFAKSTLLKLVNLNDREYASAEFARWVKAKGKVFKGLQDRRACEATLFLGRLEGDAKGQFRRSECVFRGATPSSEMLIDIDIGEQ